MLQNVLLSRRYQPGHMLAFVSFLHAVALLHCSPRRTDRIHTRATCTARKRHHPTQVTPWTRQPTMYTHCCSPVLLVRYDSRTSPFRVHQALSDASSLSGGTPRRDEVVGHEGQHYRNENHSMEELSGRSNGGATEED